MSLETLLSRVRDNPNIKGIPTTLGEHKVAGYRWFIVFHRPASHHLTQFASWTTILRKTLKFQDLFLKIRGDECEPTSCYGDCLARQLSILVDPIIAHIFGVFLTPKENDLFGTNFLPFLAMARKYLSVWLTKLRSWLGRSSTLKLTTLPAVSISDYSNLYSQLLFKTTEKYVRNVLVGRQRAQNLSTTFGKTQVPWRHWPTWCF